MIIVKIIGGLGNQMFQYATARAIRERTGIAVKLDLDDFKDYPHHAYGLDKLNISLEASEENESMRFKRIYFFLNRLPITIQKILKKTGLYPKLLKGFGYIKECSFPFNTEVYNLSSNAYLDGYWQSEKYFHDIRDILKDEFKPREPLGVESADIARLLMNKVETPVCLHIRRGDFANNPEQAKYHGLCSMDYYQNAVNVIASKTQDPHFFIFSDSIDWVRSNFAIDYPVTYTGQGPDKNHEDITLMSFCKHHILSNSTFGWWGAWLAETPEQIVIAPNKWFNKGLDTRDLMPSQWIQLDRDIGTS